jgi:hypothetical protein
MRSKPKCHHHFFFEFKSSPEVNRSGQNIIAEGDVHRNEAIVALPPAKLCNESFY